MQDAGAFFSQNATANKINLTLSEMQEPTISITCKAESGDTQKYTFKIKRIDKTVSEFNGLEDKYKLQLLRAPYTIHMEELSSK